jgi:uncharacterized protein (UPF0261 family)
MKRRIAIIGSIDTKQAEILFMEQVIRSFDMEPYLFDSSGRQHTIQVPEADVTNTMLLEAAGSSWKAMESLSKRERLSNISIGLKRLVKEKYLTGCFDGIISAGGMQNTLIAKQAMNELPYGFPKVNVVPSTTMVEIDDAIGRLDDATMVNSIADIGGGVNYITAGVMRNGIAALVGQIKYGSGVYQKPEKPLIGIMNLGVINQGASQAAEILQQHNIEACMFHGTMHGAVVEKLCREGTLNGLMMLCVHDILTEAIGKYRFCKIPVLKAPAEQKIPTIISLSGMDVIDMSDQQFDEVRNTPEFAHRKYHYHNDYCVHVKASKEEILMGGELLAERLNAFTSPVTLMIPLNGFRTLTQPGEPLYDPDVDQALIRYLHEHVHNHVRVMDIKANVNVLAFSKAAAKEMERLLGIKSE